MNEFAQQQNLPEIEPTAGAMLASARKAANMSVAEVATQLRRGINQVEALEADDYTRLPGATFVRGLIRNYAKLVSIHADPVIKAYENAVPRESTPKIGLEASRIRFQDNGHGFGMPQIKAPTPRALGITAAAILAAGALWFFSGDRFAKPSGGSPAPEAASIKGVPAAPVTMKADTGNVPAIAIDKVISEPAKGEASVAAAPVAAIPVAATSSAAELAAQKAADEKVAAQKLADEKLAVQKAAAERAAAEKAEKVRLAEIAAAEKLAADKAAAEKIANDKAAEKATKAAATEKLAADKAAAEKQAADKAAAIATEKAAQKAEAEKTAAEKARVAAQAADEAKAKRIMATARLKFRGEAWVEVTDGRGRTVYSEMNSAGSSKEITGVPPLSFTIGNAEKVSLTFNGKPVDLAPHTGREVARVKLQ